MVQIRRNEKLKRTERAKPSSSFSSSTRTSVASSRFSRLRQTHIFHVSLLPTCCLEALLVGTSPRWQRRWCRAPKSEADDDAEPTIPIEARSRRPHAVRVQEIQEADENPRRRRSEPPLKNAHCTKKKSLHRPHPETEPRCHQPAAPKKIYPLSLKTLSLKTLADTMSIGLKYFKFHKKLILENIKYIIFLRKYLQIIK